MDIESLHGLLDVPTKIIVRTEYAYFGKVIEFSDSHVVFIDNRGKNHVFAFDKVLSLDPARGDA